MVLASVFSTMLNFLSWKCAYYASIMHYAITALNAPNYAGRIGKSLIYGKA